MFEVLPENVIEFLRGMVPARSLLLQKIEAECLEEYIPLVEPEVGRFLQVQLSIKQARRILEIGTGLGYSGILLADCLSAEGSWADRDGHITTIEIDRARYERACANIRSAGYEQIITPLHGDAALVIPTLSGTFDFVFMDAAKGQYLDFFQKFWPKLESGGVIIVDNVFLSGWVIEMAWPERRKKTMVCRVREFLEMLNNHPELQTAIVPIGDGMAVCVKK